MSTTTDLLTDLHGQKYEQNVPLTSDDKGGV
jgi:hypothetical protein